VASTHTEISWTDRTWNPMSGCTRVSDGCRHCYAERMAYRFSGPGKPYEGLVKKVGNEARWTGEIKLVEKDSGIAL
jgi:protein gp37